VGVIFHGSVDADDVGMPVNEDEDDEVNAESSKKL
jgi:hypothetical protein